MTPRLYEAYTYAYPHKTAYRPFVEPFALADLWADEDRSALYLYIHIPFCEQRCGFCNLFTLSNPAEALEADYLAALERQAVAVRSALGESHFARLALGGGTPTFLSPAALARVLAIAETFGIAPGSVPASVESSPQTATPDRLKILREWGVQRISLGVQSFRTDETRAAGRTQSPVEVHQALEVIRALAFPVLNIDLIYGLPGQTVTSWLASLEAALAWQPEELFFYPLYVRPLTGLARHAGQPADADREDLLSACYRAAVDRLHAAGYQQASMRCFRAPNAPPEDGPVYCVQDDGMVGLGCGARSYTRAVHYASDYAVRRAGVREILADYLATPAEAFALAHHGFVLNDDEQRRRYVLKSLLETDGLFLANYHQRFGSDSLADLPIISELLACGWAAETAGVLALTPAGTARSDMIGPLLYSPAVRRLTEAYERR